MYAIKIMSGENKADSDVGKGFKMIVVDAGDTFEFGHDPDTGKPQVTVTGYRDGENTLTIYPVTGNAYVVSDSGKTIASFWARSLWDDAKVLEITVDENDPNPEATIAKIQKIILQQFEDEQAMLEAHGLTPVQMDLIKNGPTHLANNREARLKQQRSRCGYLMSQGIPESIAMKMTMYLIDHDNAV